MARPEQLPLAMPVAICLVAGIALAEFLVLPAELLLGLVAFWLVVATWLRRKSLRRESRFALFAAILLLGSSRWTLSQQPASAEFTALAESDQVVTLRGTICNVPIVRRQTHDETGGRSFGAAEQTRFEIDNLQLLTGSQTQSKSGRLQVFVEQDATHLLSGGDTIDLTGRLSATRPPSNPGQFDFATRLRRERIAGRLFVNHPAAIRLHRQSSWLQPLRWSSELRYQSSRLIRQYVEPTVQGMALALLLGDRNEIPAETEQAFVASGTMHLLAISGLHVGVLFVLVLRIWNWLFVSRNRALLLTLLICIVYSMMTGGRPSVVRATVFIALYVAAELLGRLQKLSSLVSVTAVVMLIARPSIVFDTGAWLSFLSVSALAWLRTPNANEPAELPPDALTFRDRLRAVRGSLLQTVGLRQRQMLAILMLTAPLVAVGFHVVAPIGILLNVVLLPFVVPVLWLGFLSLFAGLLWPPLAWLPATAFSAGLLAVQKLVAFAAEWHVGHIYLSNIGAWFVPLYYGLLLCILLSHHRHRRLRRLLLSAVFVTVSVGFAAPGTQEPTGLRCTVLDVGHGNAVVLESEGGVLLVDAGAMNRGEAAADLISSYLWQNGHRTLSGIVISHADADHYNAVSHLLRRFHVAELQVPNDVEESSAESFAQLLQRRPQRTTLRVLNSGYQSVNGRLHIEVFQASNLSPEASDNERSLAVLATFAGRKILLPGDLEGTALVDVLSRLPAVDVLLSPHHGAAAANTPLVALILQPTVVVVSSGDEQARSRLNKVYAEAKQLFFTRQSGAVTVQVDERGQLQVHEFLQHNEAAEFPVQR